MDSFLLQYGWTDAVASLFTNVAPVMPGRVVRVDRGRVMVATHDGLESCAVGARLGDSAAAVGDWVELRGTPGYDLSVESVLDRSSVMVRRDPTPGENRYQTLAANLDEVLILYRLDRKVRPAVLERYMVMVWDSGAVPVVVLTKADLISTEQLAQAGVVAAAATGGVAVHAISCITGFGLESLRAAIRPGTTVGVVGESGAGKSTLINSLTDSDLDTGSTREGDGKGRHTTTVRQMIPLGDGAVLVDTPGLRSVGLTDGTEGMAQVFADVEELMANCRFRDCEHRTEPGCAILAAIADGGLEARRFDSYRKLQREQIRVAARQAALASRAERKDVARQRRKSAAKSREP